MRSPGDITPPSRVSVRSIAFPFVGRARELAILDAANLDAHSGRGWTVLVAGEQGSGKSRLLDTFIERADAAGSAVLHGRAFDADGTPPFWAWRTTVEALVGRSSELLPFGSDEARTVLRQLSRSREPNVGSSSRHALYHRLAQLFLDASRSVASLVIAQDDLHWADRASVEFFSYLARLVGSSNVVLVGTFCGEAADQDAAVAVAGALRNPNSLRLDLGPLRVDDIVELVGPEGDRRARAGEIVAVTGGNAFLVTEVLRDGGLSDAAPAATQVPRSVRTLVSSRLAALSVEAVEVVELAAVLGRRGSLDVLAAMSAPLGGGALEGAIRVGLLDDVGEGFAFRHALVRQSVLELLPPRRRAQFEAAAARALRARNASDDLWPIARHLTTAARVDQSLKAEALAAWQRAARHASALSAHDDAASHLREAVDLAPESERAQLLVELGSATLRAGNPAVAREHFSTAAAATTDAGLLAAAALGYEDACLMEGGVRPERSDPAVELLMRALSEQSPFSTRRTALAAALARAKWYNGEPDAAQWLDTATDNLSTADDEGTMRTAFARRVLAGGPGHAEDAAMACSELADVALTMGRRDVVLDAMRQRILSLVELGALDEADDEIEQFERLVTRWQEPLFLPYAPLLRAMRMLHRGDFQTAKRLNRRVVELSRSVDSIHTTQMALMQRFALARWTGSTARYPQQLLAFAGATGSAPLWYCAAALAEVENGYPDLARKHLDKALGPDGTNHLRHNEWFLMGTGIAALVCAQLNDSERSLVLYRDLLPHRRFLLGNVAPIFGPVAHVAAIAALSAGQDAEAAELLADAGRHSEALGCRPFAVEAYRALRHTQPVDAALQSRAESWSAELGMAATTSELAGPRGQAQLSPREQEVLHLITEGRSNEEIATALYISYRTVKTHVSAVLRKLGARDRTHAAALSRDRDSPR